MTRQGAFKFLQQFMKNCTIARQPGSGRSSKVTEEVTLIVEDQMWYDDETILSIAWPFTPGPTHLPDQFRMDISWQMFLPAHKRDEQGKIFLLCQF